MPREFVSWLLNGLGWLIIKTWPLDLAIFAAVIIYDWWERKKCQGGLYVR